VAQSKSQILSLLSQAGTEPRHRFGQNFMIDQNLVRLVADAGKVSSDEVVIEVGPGTGTLTEELLARAGRVLAVEIDRDLAALLRERFGSDAKFELIEGDALAGKHELNPALRFRLGTRPAKLVANLPYNIASPLIIDLLIAGVELLAFTVQKEVADRLRAGANDDAYGPLSVMAQMLARVELLRTLPPQAFWPAPKIDSALVRMTRDDKLGARAGDFSTFVHQIFGFRRKTLRKALAQAGYDSQVLERLGIDGQLRPENITPQQFLSLFDELTARPSAA
jgi:16S rRNA (adenine1518-N6/adenine1519-N6)-dimethyltransferase